MTLNDVRGAIVNTLKADAVLKALKADVRTHRGRFTVEDLKTVAALPMSVLVSCLAVKGAEAGDGMVSCRCLWGAFPVTTDRPQAGRDASALVILTRLLEIIPTGLWGLDISAPRHVEATNLYSGQLDARGVAIWAVTWEQSVDLVLTADNADGMGKFLTFLADWDLAPRDGKIVAQDDVRLPGPA